MRIAAIYWPTTGVGGINTELVALREEAHKNGHKFDVFRSGKHSTITANLFDAPKRIAGGDTHVIIHGEAPHHPKQIENTIKFLEANYDALYFAFICPHPNKEYGDEPHFLPLFTECKLPKVARVTDPFFDSYKEFAILCVDKVKQTFVANPAYLKPLLEVGLPFKHSPQPFLETKIQEERSKTPLLCWTSQWKTRKGLHIFYSQICELSKHMRVELYGNGIEYYKYRKTNSWKEIVNNDFFDERYNGNGKADFYGNVTLDEVFKALSRSWYMVDLQGYGNNKYSGDTGSYNITTLEALYYGSCPILSESARESSIPHEFYLSVKSDERIIDVINRSGDFALDPYRQKKSREWVLDTHSTSIFYSDILKSLNSPDPVYDKEKIKSVLGMDIGRKVKIQKENKNIFDLFSL